jgi:hypothetical protein
MNFLIANINLLPWLGFFATLIAGAVSWGRSNQRLSSLEAKVAANELAMNEQLKMLNEKHDDALSMIMDKLSSLQSSGEALRVAVIGIDGQNGLRGEIREVKTMMNDIYTRLSNLEKQK